ncbi:MAG TPA: hypothetical protein VGA02_05680 [Gemmatimonadales bacterium]|jgi:predicted nucleic-acid-binding protein
MIALDTNVVVRFLVADEPRQAARAEGCEAVVTFDRVLLREEGFRAP